MKRISRLLVALFLCVASAARGADEKPLPFPTAGDESDKYHTEVVVDGLDNPCGLALRPNTDRDAPPELLFAESGVGRVLAFATERPAESREIVTGLKVSDVEELESRASAWSLGFVTPTKLAVFGGMPAGRDRVGVYLLPDENASLTADKQDHEVVIDNGESDSQAVLGSMTISDTMAYFASGSLTPPGQVFRAGLAANRIELPQPQLNTAEALEARWPTGLCLSPSGKMQFVVTSLAGELTEARDSRVVFLIPTSGKRVLELVPGLVDVVGLAYSVTGQLYAIDLAWQSEKQGGIYRLDDVRYNGQPACRAVKIAEVNRPTSLLFADGGTLYVTVWGKGGNAKSGQIVKITGEF